MNNIRTGYIFSSFNLIPIVITSSQQKRDIAIKKLRAWNKNSIVYRERQFCIEIDRGGWAMRCRGGAEFAWGHRKPFPIRPPAAEVSAFGSILAYLRAALACTVRALNNASTHYPNWNHTSADTSLLWKSIATLLWSHQSQDNLVDLDFVFLILLLVKKNSGIPPKLCGVIDNGLM